MHKSKKTCFLPHAVIWVSGAKRETLKTRHTHKRERAGKIRKYGKTHTHRHTHTHTRTHTHTHTRQARTQVRTHGHTQTRCKQTHTHTRTHTQTHVRAQTHTRTITRRNNKCKYLSRGHVRKAWKTLAQTSTHTHTHTHTHTNSKNTENCHKKDVPDVLKVLTALDGFTGTGPNLLPAII